MLRKRRDNAGASPLAHWRAIRRGEAVGAWSDPGRADLWRARGHDRERWRQHGLATRIRLGWPQMRGRRSDPQGRLGGCLNRTGAAFGRAISTPRRLKLRFFGLLGPEVVTRVRRKACAMGRRDEPPFVEIR